MRKIMLSVYIVAMIMASCNTVQESEKEGNRDLGTALEKSSIRIDLPVADIAILGTFHFVANVDSYRRRFHVDITASDTQKEIGNLIEQLSAYGPTKVLIEQPIADTQQIDSLYHEYVMGKYTLGHDESQQLGFRLAKAMGHQHIYPVDVHPPYDSEFEEEDWDAYAKKTNKLPKLQYLRTKFEEHYQITDSLKTVMPLIDYYRLLNSDDMVKIALQEKLDGLVELGANDKYLGADGIAYDYRRNLRIYANILSLIDSDSDRFLLIIGANHLTILKPFFENSLEFDYKPISNYLQP